MIGRTVSHYRILSALGSGGMGTVYRAEDLTLGRHVALKFLPPHLSADPDARRRFVHEAKAAAFLDHSGICTVHEVGEADGQSFIAMALLEGQTLKERIAAGPLPLPEALEVAAQVAEALHEAHGKGVVHRDVKPANIMLTPKGQAKVMDFGLAQVAGASQLTRSGSTLGTAAYMSPEQARSEGVDRRTDIWSLGVVLYEMVSGRRPFPGEHEAALLYGIQQGEPEPLTGLRTGVPVELERIVGKCLAKGAGRRYQHADELAVDLRRLLCLSSSPHVPVTTGRRRRRSWMLAIGTALGVVGLSLLWTVARHMRPTAASGTPRLAIAGFASMDANPDLVAAAGLAALLQVGLVGGQGYDLVSPEYLSDIRRRKIGSGSASAPPEQVLAVAREADAKFLLAGEFVSNSGVTHVTWRVTETQSGRGVAAGRADAGEWTTLADQVAQAVSRVLPVLGEREPNATALPSTGFLTDNPDAYRHYAASLVAEEDGHYGDARRELLRAVELDSTFALALFALSRVVDWNSEMALAQSSAQRAMRHVARLGPKERALLEAHRLCLDYKVAQAVRAYDAVLSRWPDTREALVRRAQTYFFFRYWEEARASAEDGRRFYPDNRDLLQVLASALSQLGRWETALQIARQDPAPRAWSLDAMGAVGDIYLRLAMPDSAELAYRATLASEPNDFWSAMGMGWCAYARGDLERAIQLLQELYSDQLRAAQGGIQLIMGMDLIGLPVLYADAGRLADIPSLLTRRGVRGYYPEFYLVYAGLAREAGPALRKRVAVARATATGPAYLGHLSHLGIALARAGDVREARTICEELVPAVAADSDLPRGFYQRNLEMAAVLALAEKKPHEALSRLEELSRDGYVRLGATEIQIVESEAEAWAQAGQPARAIAILQDLVRVYGGRSLAHFKLGELYEQTDRRAEARAAYAKCLALWAHADPGYPYVARARARLAVLNR
jgi:tetratricopeptide (TPR) repeat protein